MVNVGGQDLLAASSTGKIDLLAGCPPCQGFSSLTIRKDDDPRNLLVREMTRLLKEVKPRIFMMENVPGLATKGKHLFEELLRELDELGYLTNFDILQIADYGVPQSRRRLVLLAGQGFQIGLPKPTHSKSGTNGLIKWKTLKETIWGMKNPITLSAAMAKGGPQAFNWHVVRDMKPLNRERLKNTLPGRGRGELPVNLRPPCHQKSDHGYHNVYGRLSWDQASVTITGGCTTLSKGRYGHPSRQTTLSVREAAMIQTFPDSFVIDTPHMEVACNIIGNALPCDFAEVLAHSCMKALKQFDQEGRKIRSSGQARVRKGQVSCPDPD